MKLLRTIFGTGKGGVCVAIGIALMLASAFMNDATGQPNPPLPNPNNYTAVAPGSAKRCETIRAVVTPNCGGALWDSVIWTLSRLEFGSVNNYSIQAPYYSNHWNLDTWNNGCIWFYEWDPEGPANLELTLIGQPGETAAVWAEYGWNGTVRNLEFQSTVAYINILPGDSTTLNIFSSKTKLPADGTSSALISTVLKDQNCAPIANQPVTFSTTKGTLNNGSVQGASVTVNTGSNGYATCTLIADTTAGMATVTASAMGYSASVEIQMYSSIVTVSANPTSIPADGVSTSTIGVTVLDLNNQPVSDKAVTLTASAGVLKSGAIGGQTIILVTDGSGSATALLEAGYIPAQATVTGSAQDAASGSTVVTFTQPINPPVNQKNKLGNGNPVSQVNDPVHAGLGNYIYSKYLFALPGKGLPFSFEVNYNSLDNTYNGPLGYGWTHTFNVVLTPPTPPSTDVTIKWGDGHEDTWQGDGAGNFTPVNCTTPVKLTMPDSSHYLATLQNKNTYQFDSSGRLLAITDLNGNQIAFTYSTTPPNQVDHITDTAGRQIAFVYEVSGHITAITSPLKAGNTVSFQYDGSGNLTGIVGPRGKTWGFTYDGSHRILTHIDAKGTTVVTNAYDTQGRVSQQTDGAGHITTYAYTVNVSGTTTVVTPPSGNAITHVYDLAYNLTNATDGESKQGILSTDSKGRLYNATDKKGGMVQFTYDANNNLDLVSDRTGATARFVYNSQNRPTTVIDPLNSTTSFGYDANGNLTSATNPNGASMGITVDGSGLPTTITDFLGKSWGFAYDASGLPQTITDPMGAQTGFTYDSAGRVTQVNLPVSGVTVQATWDDAGNMLTRTDPLGYVSNFTYDDNGDLATATFVPTNATTTYSYDWSGHPLTVTDALGGVTTYTYDLDGNLVSVTDPDGITLTRQYDKANRLTAVVDALGHHVYYGYDVNGNVTSVKNEIGKTWTTTFDAEGRPLQTTDPLGNKTTRVYDAAGKVTGITDPLNHTTTYQYDAASRLVSTTLPDQGVINYTNNPSGLVTALTDPLGHTWGFSYDDAKRLTAKTDPKGKTESYVRDAMGRITQKTQRDGTVIAYAYDENSRLTGVTLPGPITMTYGYDAAGNLTSVVDPSGTTTMTYDKLGRRLTRTDSSGKTIAYSYTPGGRLSSMTYPGSKTVSYAYDTVGRLTTITDWLANQTTYQYDSVNRVTQITLPNGTRTLYTYDAAGRVATQSNQKANGTVIASYSYTYDGAGHITSVQRSEPTPPTFASLNATYTYDPVNRVLTANLDSVSTAYTFDDRGNLTSKTADSTTTSYTYDALNRLSSVSDGTNTTNYTYDAAGNRLVKTFNSATARYVREGGTIFCILDGSGNIQSYNIYAGGSLLYSLDGSGAVKVYHSDERGSVVAITDASQTAVQSYSYDPYGKVVGTTGSLSNAFQYVGTHGVMADENGLYHMQARYYDPGVRRFITEDPAGFAAGLNLYGYVGGDPINRIDPQGLGWGDCMKFGEGFNFILPNDQRVDEATYRRFYNAYGALVEAGEQNSGTLFTKAYQTITTPSPSILPATPSASSVLPSAPPTQILSVDNPNDVFWTENPMYLDRLNKMSVSEYAAEFDKALGENLPIYRFEPLPPLGKIKNYDKALGADLEFMGPGGIPQWSSKGTAPIETMVAADAGTITVGGIIKDSLGPAGWGYLYLQVSFPDNSLVTDTDGTMIPMWLWKKKHIDPHVPQWFKNLNAARVKINEKVNPYNPVLWPIYIAGYVYNKGYNFLDNAFSNKKAWEAVRELNQ